MYKTLTSLALVLLLITTACWGGDDTSQSQPQQAPGIEDVCSIFVEAKATSRDWDVERPLIIKLAAAVISDELEVSTDASFKFAAWLVYRCTGDYEHIPLN